jgi:hypothetical protein
MTTSPSTIIAYAADDGRYDHVAKAATDTAAQSQARLIFYDIDAPGLLKDLVPAGGMDIPDGELLDGSHLQAAGRNHVAEQVERARRSGIDAYAWIPAEGGADELGRYAETIAADMILLPADLLQPSLFDRLRGRALPELEDMSETPVAIIHRSGEVTMCEPVSQR